MTRIAVLFSLAALMVLSGCVTDAPTPRLPPTATLTPTAIPTLIPVYPTRTPPPDPRPRELIVVPLPTITIPTPVPPSPTAQPDPTAIPPTPTTAPTIEEQCFTLLDAVDQERIAEAQERGRRWPARLARDDMVATCAHAVRMGLGDVETIVAQFAGIDFSTNLNAYGATSEEKPTPTPTPIPPTPKPEQPRDAPQDTPDESDVQDSPADPPTPETPDPRIAAALDAYNAAVEAEEQARRAWVSATSAEASAKAAYDRTHPDCDWLLGFEQCDYTEVDAAKAEWDAAKAATRQALNEYRAAQRDTKAAHDAYQGLVG